MSSLEVTKLGLIIVLKLATMSLARLFAVLLIVPVCTARQSTGPTLFLRSGNCAVPSVQQNFNLSAMAGRWYQHSRFPSLWEYGRCSQLIWDVAEDGKTAQIRWEQILENSSINFAESIATIKNEKEKSKLTLNFIKPKSSWETPFWIVKTDYDDYALIYSCYPHFHQKLKRAYNAEYAWLMSRSRTMGKRQKGSLKNTLKRLRIYTRAFIDTNQNNCTEYENEDAHYFSL